MWCYLPVQDESLVSPSRTPFAPPQNPLIAAGRRAGDHPRPVVANARVVCYAVGVEAAGVPSGTIGSTSRRMNLPSRGPTATMTVPSGAINSAVYGAVAVFPVSSTSIDCRLMLVPGAYAVGSGLVSW
jgi:hypothetical protein